MPAHDPADATAATSPGRSPGLGHRRSRVRVRARAVVTGLCAVLLACLTGLALPSPSSAFCRASTSTAANGPCEQAADATLLYWDRGCYSYSFHQNVFQRFDLLTEAQTRAIFQRAFDTWQAVDCGYVPFVVDQKAELASTPWPAFVYDEPNEAIVTALTPEEWPQLQPTQPTSAFAITFLWHDTETGELLDVDIALNLGQGPFGDCGNQRCRDGTVDLENTITHEAGHAMGLGHATNADATMFPDAMPGVIFMRDLTPDDEAGLCAMQLPSHDCGGAPGDISCMCPPPPVVSSVVIREGLCACALGARSRGLPLTGLWALAGLLLWRRARHRVRGHAGRRSGRRPSRWAER